MMKIATAEVAIARKIDTAAVIVGVMTMTTKIDTMDVAIAGVMTKKMTVGARTVGMITLTVGTMSVKATGVMASRNHILTLTSPTICLNPSCVCLNPPGVCLPAVRLPVARALHKVLPLLPV
jgi:hypothetical protein